MLSNAASNDITGIYKYGLQQSGEKQTKKYLNELVLFLNSGSRNQNLVREVSMFSQELKYDIFKKHIVFYRIVTKNSIFVIRILGRRINSIEHI